MRPRENDADNLRRRRDGRKERCRELHTTPLGNPPLSRRFVQSKNVPAGPTYAPDGARTIRTSDIGARFPPPAHIWTDGLEKRSELAIEKGQARREAIRAARPVRSRALKTIT
ncbi:hypothetical protein GCM10017688_15090 [Streptomyces ramulosus]